MPILRGIFFTVFVGSNMYIPKGHIAGQACILLSRQAQPADRAIGLAVR
jgi:hypothetical protein